MSLCDTFFLSDSCGKWPRGFKGRKRKSDQGGLSRRVAGVDWKADACGLKRTCSSSRIQVVSEKYSTNMRQGADSRSEDVGKVCIYKRGRLVLSGNVLYGTRVEHGTIRRWCSSEVLCLQPALNIVQDGPHQRMSPSCLC